MTRFLRLVLPALAAVLFTAVGSTYGQTYMFSLDALQEVPPNASPGTGSCTVVLDDILDNVDVSCTYAGLTVPANASHIHAPAPPGVNAGVVLGLPNTGGTSGSINVVDAGLSQTNINHILAGNAYVNIHNANFPGGEIRGQIVPEPASLGLLGIGALALIRRRRAA